MKIAVLLGLFQYDSQRKMVDGIIDGAEDDKNDVFIFICSGEEYNTTSKYELGEFSIYSLPDFKNFDAIIVTLDTIHNPQLCNDIIEKIRISGTPCVSINRFIEDFICVQLDNHSGMREIAEHLHTKHGVKTAFYISGAAENNDSQERMETLFDYFQEIGMPLTQNDIGYGDYTYKSGFDVTDSFLSSGRDLPDAFIAANDKMAIGAVARLKLSGIEVPRDVIVTGYDDSEVANIHYPGITSVRRGEFCAGRLAYSLAKEAFSKGKKPDNQIVSGIAAISESCGCTSTGALKEELVRNRFAESSMSYEIKLNYLRHLMAESTSLSSYEEYLSVAKKYILLINPREIYICLFGDADGYFLQLKNFVEGVRPSLLQQKFEEKSMCIIAYKDGRFLPDCSFRTVELIPPRYPDKEKSNYFYFLPLHHGDDCFGYIVFGNQKDLNEDPFMSFFSLVVSSALEEIKQLNRTNLMMEKLDNMRVIDNLTGVLNRDGMDKYCPALQAYAEEHSLLPAVLFMDLNRLKSVNDRFGHSEGDRYIAVIADILKKVCNENDLLVRVGGDEFLLITCVNCEDELEKYISIIRKKIDEYKKNHLCGYDIGVCIGKYISDRHRPFNLEEMISNADNNMYLEKRCLK